MMARLRGEARTARSIRPDVSSRLDGIMARALALRPADRYQTMRAFATDLGTVGTERIAQPPFPSLKAS